jgi:hypothetical protein
MPLIYKLKKLETKTPTVQTTSTLPVVQRLLADQAEREERKKQRELH